MRLLTATALAALFAASPAGAQPSRDPAMAEALFARAKVLLEQGDWQAACAKFQASMELDPAVSTLLKIAKCHEHEGKLAVAWSDVHEALKLNATIDQPENRRRELEAYALQVIAALTPRVPKIRVRVKGAPAGLRVTYDGRPLPVEALDEPLPVDPGAHEILAEAPGHLPLRQAVTVTEGQALDVDLALTPRAEPVSSPPPSASPASPATSRALAVKAFTTRLEATEGRRPSPVQRVAGVGVGALGVAALGTAGVLGLLTRGKVDDAAPYCRPDFSSCHDPQGLSLLDQARDMQTAAFVLLGAGVAASGAGVALFLTAPRAADAAPLSSVTAILGARGLTLRGAW